MATITVRLYINQRDLNARLGNVASTPVERSVEELLSLLFAEVRDSHSGEVVEPAMTGGFYVVTIMPDEEDDL